MFSYLRRGPGFYRRVGGLAVPIILQNLITSTLAMADTFMVGMLGEVPMAAVTLAALAGLVLQLNILWVYLAMSTEQLVKCIAGVVRLRTGKWIHDLTRPQTIE